MRVLERKRFSGLVILVAAALLLLAAPSLAGQYKILRVCDGDTISINYQGKEERVRLLRVDTPESVHPDKKQNIPMGKTAAEYTEKRLAGKSIDLEFEGERKDRHGRLLAYVFVGGKNYCLELVEKGLSPYYTKYGLSKKYDKEFRQAETQARKQGLGIWGDPELTQKYLRLKSKWGHGTANK